MPLERLIEPVVNFDVRDTGFENGHELYQQFRLLVENPYAEDSIEKPEACFIHAIEWHRSADRERPWAAEGKKRQFVVMNGINTGAHEPMYFLSALMPDADTVITLSHPDAPQAWSEHMATTPFNDVGSFKNSGVAIHKAIEQLYAQGKLDKDSPLTLILYSGSTPVGLEAAVYDQSVFEVTKSIIPDFHKSKLIDNIAIYAPAGFVDMDIYKELKITEGFNLTKFVELLGSDTVQYFTTELVQDWFDELRQKTAGKIDMPTARSYVKHKIKELHSNWQHARERFQKDKDQIAEWPDDPAWQKIIKSHILFSWFELLTGIADTSFIKRRFHRIWPTPPFGPHFADENPAYERVFENISMDVCSVAAGKITDTNIYIWAGMNDHIAPTAMFFKEEEKLRAKFEKNYSRTRITFDKGNHLTPKGRGLKLVKEMMKYFYGSPPEQQ